MAEPPSPAAPPVAPPLAFYAVAKGWEPGIYDSYKKAKKQIDGYTHWQLRKFATLQEAQEYMDSNGKKKPDTVQIAAANHEKYKATVYTDGACIGQGSSTDTNSVWYGGVGVWFGEGDPRNISEPLAATADRMSTNNRAELTAVLRVFQWMLESRTSPVLIFTDSTYAQKVATDWLYKWRDAGWRKKDGQTPANIDLLMELSVALQECASRRLYYTIRWVKGHADCVGNVAADKLATTAAQRAKQFG